MRAWDNQARGEMVQANRESPYKSQRVLTAQLVREWCIHLMFLGQVISMFGKENESFFGRQEAHCLDIVFG